MEVYNPSGSKIYTSISNATNSTVSFTYKLSGSAVGGEYAIKIYGSSLTSNAMVFRVRDYSRDQIEV